VIWWNRLRPWLGTLVRLGLGAIWIVAAVDKLGNPRTFVQAVRAYDATPEWLSKAIGYGLPVLELCVGVLLVVGIVTRAVAIVSGLLFVVFLIGISQAAARGIQLECGCFGGGGATTAGTTYTLDILRDIGLLILAAFLVVWPMTRLSLDEFIARNDRVDQPSAKRMRSDQGRRKYNALLEQRRKEALSRNRWISASMAAVVVLVCVIGLGVQSNRAKIQGSLTAAHATVSDGVVYGKKAAATVDVYEDFQCPNCENFEKDAGKTIDAAVKANKAQVRFHIMSFLDSSSNGNRYSSRAANAALCASDISVDAFVKYHNILYGTYKGKQVQPAEGTNGRSDTDLENYGKAAGFTSTQMGTFTQCVSTEKHKALVEALQDKASENGVNGTPTIKVNGKKIDPTAAAFTKAVNAALKNGPSPSPSPKPSPTSTSTSTPTKASTSSSSATG